MVGVLRAEPGKILLAHLPIEPGQDHPAPFQPRDHAEQRRHGRKLTEAPRRPDRMHGRRLRPGSGLGFEQRHLPRGRIDQPLPGEPSGPCLRHDAEKVERGLPVRRELGGHHARKRCAKIDLRPLGLVLQMRKLGRQSPGAVRPPGRPARPSGGQNESAQHRKPLGRTHRGREIQRTGKRKRRLVQRPERGNARQQHRPPAARAQERFGQRPRRSPCRQQDQPLRGPDRIAPARPKPCFGNAVEERASRRQRKEIHRLLPVSRASMLDSASTRSAGLERWNQSPSWTIAASLPASIARLQSSPMPNRPFGASRKSPGPAS